MVFLEQFFFLTNFYEIMKLNFLNSRAHTPVAMINLNFQHPRSIVLH